MMGVEDSRYFVDCISFLDETFKELSVLEKDVSLANRIQGALITSGIIEGALKLSKKNSYSVSKKPDEEIKTATMKYIIKNFNNYTRQLINTQENNYKEIMTQIKEASENIFRNEELSRYVSPSKIEKTENLFLYVRDSLFKGNTIKEDIYFDWFVEEIPITGNLRMSEDLDRFLEFHHNELFRRRKSKSVRSRLLSKEYDYLVLQIGEVKKQFDLRYFLNE